MERKVKFFHPLHLYCVSTLPSKTNTAFNIGVKCSVNGDTSVATFMMSVGVSRMRKTRVVFIDPWGKVNISYYCNIVLEKGLLPDIRAICRHCRWTLQQDGAPAHTARTRDYPKKTHQLHWTSHVAIRGLRYLGCSSATSLPPTTIQDGGRTEASHSHPMAKTLSVLLITVSMNGVDVLKLLSRMAKDTLQNSLSRSTSFSYYREISLVNKTKHLIPILAVVFVLLGNVVIQ